MKTRNEEIVLVAAKRTPFGTYGGELRKLSATDMGVQASRAALEQVGARGDEIDHVIFGNVMQTSSDAIYLARHVGLRAGLPQHVPALTLNRLCGSGFQAVVNAAQEILTGQAETVLCGGTESMSQAPHVFYGARFGVPLGKAPMVDYLWESLYDPLAEMAMNGTAEKLGREYGVTREEADAYAALSQQRFAAAQEAGRFDEEMAPVTIKSRKGDKVVDKDEHNRPDTTAEKLGKLPPAFGEGGSITAGNASGICDGAGAMIVTTRSNAESRGWTPLARLQGWGIAGVDPTIMGVGPVEAIRKGLRATELSLDDLELVEVNEAFAPQYCAVEKELGLDREITNVDGGAIAVGHPLAASGARITTHLIYELRRRGQRLGCGSACIGGGQGIALMLEAL